MAANERQEKVNTTIQYVEKLEQSVGSNRDTEGLGVMVMGPFIVGRVDEINGEDGTEEPAFLATRHELRQLALYWMQERLEHDFDWFLYHSTGSKEWRWSTYIGRRLNRLHRILGPEAMDSLWTQASTAFRRTWPNLTDDDWRVFSEGSDEDKDDDAIL